MNNYKSIAFASAVLLLTGTAMAQDSASSHRGNIVIADQFNNRIIEVNPANHNVVWHFGDGSFTPGPHSIVGPNDAERVGLFTLISGTGIPANTPPCPKCGRLPG